MAVPLAGTGASAAALSGFSYSEVNSLARIKQADAPAGLKAAAQQFESLFLDLILKGARDATAAIATDDYTSSDATRFEQEMLDHQWAVHLSEHGGVGLSGIIVKQLSAQVGATRVHPDALSSLPDRTADSTPSARPAASTPVPQSSAAPPAEPAPSAAPVADASGAVSGATDATPVVTALATTQVQDDSPQSFVERVLPLMQRALAGTPFNPVGVLAQAALETGWGKRVIHTADGRSSNNLFGIKADGDWSGDSATVGTLEFLSGRATQVLDRFRAYPSLEAAVQDYTSFLTSDPRYRAVVDHAQDPQRFADELQKAGYATDPSYARKLRDVLDSAPLRALHGQGALRALGADLGRAASRF